MIPQSRATERGIERVPRSIGMTCRYVLSMNENFPASELATTVDGDAALRQDARWKCPSHCVGCIRFALCYPGGDGGSRPTSAPGSQTETGMPLWMNF